jgi:hypothetical protein
MNYDEEDTYLAQSHTHSKLQTSKALLILALLPTSVVLLSVLPSYVVFVSA